MLDDWLAFAGTEVINGARTHAYITNMLAGLALEYEPCEDLAAALGETYSSPVQDAAPWYSPYNTASGEFFGLIPLSLEGFDDSTQQVAYTEGIAAGGYPGRARSASRPLRISALAVAGSDKGMDFGLSWLRDVLRGAGCANGDCGGDDLCFYAACPQVCQTDAPQVALDVSFPTAGDVAASTADWKASGAITATTASGIVYAHIGGQRPQVSVTLNSLAPMQWYRVKVATSKNDSVTVTLPGFSPKASFLGTGGVSIDSAPDTGGVLTFEFQANSGVGRILVSSTNTLSISSLHVERVARPSISLSQSMLGDASQAAPWSYLTDTQTNLTKSVVYSPSAGLVQRAKSSAAAVGVLNVGVTRVLGGLNVGTRYRAVALARTSYGAQPLMKVDTAYEAATPVLTDPGDSTYWVDITFTATAERHTLTIRNASTVTLTTSGDSVDMGVAYLRVEEVVTDVPSDVYVLDYPRTLRLVSNTAPMSVGKTYNSHAAVMCQVEWGMTAGAPTVLGQSISVSDSLPAHHQVVPEVTCTNGAAVLHNLLTNPSFETNTTGWSGTNTTLSRTTPAAAVAGTYALRATGTSATLINTVRANVTGAPFRTYTCSAYVRTGAPTTITLGADSYDGTAYTTLATASEVTKTGGDWVRLWATVVLPPGATAVSLRVQTAATPVGAWFEVDAAMVTEGYALAPYFDGSSTNSAWDGTANASTSTWTAATPLSAIIDPDCPPPPDPPRPPAIANDCLDTPTSWLRYVMEVPPEITQTSPVAFPELTLTTTNLDARGVRIRFYADPFLNGIEGVVDCAYCGEFWLSYLPKNASLTIDAATNTVTAVVAGSTIPASNLLYGSDGGPVVWPELSCGVGYLVTVDLDASADPLIDAALVITPGY